MLEADPVTKEQEQIEDLQARVAFQEDLLSSLNNRVAEQEQDIEVLKKQLKIVYKKVSSLAGSIESAGEEDEAPPPHY